MCGLSEENKSVNSCKIIAVSNQKGGVGYDKLNIM